MNVQATRTHQRAQEATADQAAAAVTEVWDRVDPDDIGRSWAGLVPRATTILAASQLAAALGATEYLDELLGMAAPALSGVAAGALSGVASDGRSLETLLLQPGITTRTLIQRGVPPTRALMSGRVQLHTIATTQTADAARAAEQLGMAVRPRVVAYTRVVSAKACSRCMILAGREYSWSTGFLRHPRCKCTMRPLRIGERVEGHDDPRDLFDGLTKAEQDRRFGRHAAEAIREGADMSQVVNARRGMTTAQARYTTEGTTRRGYAGRRLGNLTNRDGRYVRSATPRLMPEAIIRDARDREHALELLYEHGYLTDPPATGATDPAMGDTE
ncbi:hypothetical protein NE857_31560 [Nocardiopsis exhalans]|uniref:Capsid maturation protease n=1 Tax=Nocardiopsis exhalans TaxID=163604 RepID=A0ABY5D6T3_9ACTN|nr:hypothetical protein [Nocardiopsis exhalans]USY19717.1 hypothetical protein NE857_31560 [Nocardiopsis exhalans]